MLPTTVFSFLLMIGILPSALLGYVSPGRTTVTNDDIRDALLQVVNVVRNTDDKLERHEYRDRALGEQLKKAVINLDKRVKILEPLKNGISRLDERLAAIETLLMNNDEATRLNLEKKTVDIVEDIQHNLPVIMEQFKNEIIGRLMDMQHPPAQIIEPVISKKDFEKLKDDVLSKIKSVNNVVENVEKDIKVINQVNKNMNEMNNKSNENLEKVKRQLSASENILAQYESKLAEYNNKIPQIVQGNDFKEQEWQKNFMQALDAHRSQSSQIIQDIHTVSSKIDHLPNKTEQQLILNATEKIAKILPENFEKLQKDHKEINKTIADLSAITESLSESFSKGYEQIRTEIDELGRVEQVMIQTGDAVMDTKRRVEYGVHQIMAEVSNQIKESTKKINQAITDRFTLFELSLLDEEQGALANLTSKIGEEIDQVWRQIGIMHQQMSASTDTLNKLQNQTDQYVNGSLNVMDTMKGKVGIITGRMTEVDENLNFLLGKLSLVTQEFNQIRAGLGKALDEIKGSFHAVENQLKDVGPGPHNITQSNSIEAQ